MAAERILIRGGHVMTMDDTLDDLPSGDVLIEGERIVAVAPTVAAADARVIDAAGRVVMPGFVDTHRHTWQTQLRGLCADWTLTDYFLGIRLAISPAYTADDVYVGNYVGALEALDAGVTTILDFSHCMNTPAHADAAVRGLVDAGIRALHCYGFFAATPQNEAFPTHAARRADFARIAGHTGAGGRVTIGAALTEVGAVPWADTVAEIEAARHAGARMVAHTGCVWGSAMTGGVAEMHAHGLLGADQVHVHCNTLDAQDWRYLADAGAKVSISPETELNMGMGRLAIAACRAHGIAPTLSCDIVSLNSGDLFTQMRLALAHERMVENDRLHQAGKMPTTLGCTVRDALRWATINGADACGLASTVGSLTPGKQADVIILGDPTSFAFHPLHVAAANVIFQARPNDVHTVMVAGHLLKEAGHLLAIDRTRVLERATRSATEILKRVRSVTPELPPRSAATIDFDALARANLAGAATQ